MKRWTYYYSEAGMHSRFRIEDEQGIFVAGTSYISEEDKCFEEIKNQARLMAAAPEAVPLFRDLQEYLCEHGGEAVELLERIDAWVAKATGGAE